MMPARRSFRLSNPDCPISKSHIEPKRSRKVLDLGRQEGASDMIRKIFIAVIAVLFVGFAPQGAYARGGGGGGFRGGGGGGFRGGGGGFRGGGFRGGGFRGAGLGIGLGLGLAGAYAGYPYGYGYGYPYGYGAYGYDDGCIQLRRVRTPYGLRVKRV